MDNRERYNNYIANNIRRLRKKNGYSQAKLAEKLQTLGIDYTHARISHIELKKRPPTAALVIALKCIFDCEYSELVGEVEDECKELLGKQE